MIDGEATVEWFEEVDSTILEAQRRVERGAALPVWLVAGRQTSGRGRRGRAWVSMDGNLMATLAFESDRAPPEIALFGFATGLSLCDALDEHIGGGRAMLKWPNDVLVDGAKIAGILIDSGSRQNGRHWVGLSFGVNLSSMPEAIDQPTTSLRRLTPPGALVPAPMAFLAKIRPRLAFWSGELAARGFGALRNAWLRRAYGLGRDALVRQGEVALEGRIEGMSATGALELRTPQGLRLINAGDVFLSEPLVG